MLSLNTVRGMAAHQCKELITSRAGAFSRFALALC
jgi:hypothetical protein